MWHACACVKVGMEEPTTPSLECTSHPLSLLRSPWHVSCPINYWAKVSKGDFLSKRIFLMWKRFQATYKLPTLGKSFPPLRPTQVLWSLKSERWAGIWPLVLSLGVYKGTVQGKCMGGIWLNAHVLSGPGFNEWINVKVLYQLESTTEISTVIYISCHCHYHWLMGLEFAIGLCVGAYACAFLGQSVTLCVFFCECVSEYLILYICIYTISSSEVMNLCAVGPRNRRPEL